MSKQSRQRKNKTKGKMHHITGDTNLLDMQWKNTRAVKAEYERSYRLHLNMQY